jgi:hypothetical protein
LFPSDRYVPDIKPGIFPLTPSVLKILI